MTGTASAGPTPITADELADAVRPALRTGLIGFDVDGVLAPIVEHADDARLTDGVRENLAALAERATIAIVSGRSLADLEARFAFPPGIHVIGSHGLEHRDAAGLALDPDEERTLEQLRILADKAVEATGDGAWVEHKPASVVVHTRAADPERAAAAAAALTRLARMVPGAQVKPGHEVVELLARTASKGDALVALAERTGRSPLVFVGDDVTDEDAFARMGPDDVSVRVGSGETVARYRLDGPDDVAAVVARLV